MRTDYLDSSGKNNMLAGIMVQITIEVNEGVLVKSILLRRINNASH
jgi:hypothetical protein